MLRGTSSIARIICVYIYVYIYICIYIYIYVYIHTHIHYMYNINTYYVMHLCILHLYIVYSNIYIYIISQLQYLDLVVDCVRMCQENHNGLIGDRQDTMLRKPRFSPRVLGQKPLGLCRVPKSHWAQLGTVMGL